MISNNNIIDDNEFDHYSIPDWSNKGHVVAKFYSPFEAELAASRLRSEGVRCFLVNTESQMPQLQSIIRLQVPMSQKGLALEILGEFLTDETLEKQDNHKYTIVLIVIFIIIGLILAKQLALLIR